MLSRALGVILFASANRRFDVSQPLQLRPISNEEGNRLLRMVRRGAGNIVTWRRTQIVLWAA